MTSKYSYIYILVSVGTDVNASTKGGEPVLGVSLQQVLRVSCASPIVKGHGIRLNISDRLATGRA
jgi:hypothetical protein